MRAQNTTTDLCHTTTSILVYIEQNEVTEATLTHSDAHTFDRLQQHNQILNP